MKAVVLLVLCGFVCQIAAGKGKGNDVCSNGGIELNGEHKKCSCPHGFKGFNCKTRVTACEGKPCRNSGKCTETENGAFNCKCSDGYEGILCETKVLPCDKKPCKNGGKCSDDGHKCFTCECPDGFKGADCSQKVRACEISPCLNGGQCLDREKKQIKFECKCKPGYTGEFCERQSWLSSSSILDGKTDYVKQLNTWLGNKIRWKLCYRASKHGWASSTFHSHCDGKGPTVTIVRVGKFIFGGYTDVSWGGASRYRSSSSSFIFSLKSNYNGGPFKSAVIKSQYATYNSASYGPTFGGGHDFCIKLSGSTSSGSYSNFGHSYTTPNSQIYKYSSQNARSFLAGSYNFLVSDLEVFYYY